MHHILCFVGISLGVSSRSSRTFDGTRDKELLEKVRIRNVRSCYTKIRATHVQRNSRLTTKLEIAFGTALWVRSVMFERDVRV